MSEFKITVPIHVLPNSITKSVSADGEEKIIRRIVGIASGTEIDRDTEQFAMPALKAMQQAIEDGIVRPDGTHSLVPLQSNHQQNWLTDLGFLTKSWMEPYGSEHYNLWVEAELNDSPSADWFYTLLTTNSVEKGRPSKLGMSIGGFVTKAHKATDDLTSKSYLVFDHIRLKEVSIVSEPAYPTQWLSALAKSYQDKETSTMTQEEIKKETTTEVPVEETQEEVQKEETVAVAPAAEEAVTKETSEDAPVVEETDSDVTKAVSPEIEEIRKDMKEITKSVTDLSSILNEMKASYASLSIGFEANRDANGNPVVSLKSEKTVEDVEGIVTKNVNEAVVLLTEKAIGPLVDMIQAVSRELEEFKAQPVDKSLRILSEEEIAGRTPQEVYKARREASGGRSNPIEDAVNAAFGL